MIKISKERRIKMYTIKYTYGYYSIYDQYGTFLFSADSEKEAWEELEAM